jgi:hypothetical protein
MDGFAGHNLNAQPSIVQVLDVNGTTSKGRNELDIARVEQIVVFALESSVGLLLNLENDVASLDARSLVALASELDLGAVSDAAVDVNMKNFPVHNRLLSVALSASVLLLDELSLAAAVGADRLEPLDHGAHLAHHGLHAVAVAARTPTDSSFLASNAVALGANDGTLQCQLRDLALVDIFQRHLVNMVDCTCFRGAALLHAAKHSAETAAEAAATEELGEEILGCHTAAGSAFEALLAILVIKSALLGIREDFVRG